MRISTCEVGSDIVGVCGRATLLAVVTGESDPKRVADLSDGRLKAPRPQLMEALHGRVNGYYRFNSSCI